MKVGMMASAADAAGLELCEGEVDSGRREGSLRRGGAGEEVAGGEDAAEAFGHLWRYGQRDVDMSRSWTVGRLAPQMGLQGGGSGEGVYRPRARLRRRRQLRMEAFVPPAR